MKKLLAIFLFFISSMSVLGQIETDRPDQTEASSTVPINNLQLETGFVWEKTKNGDEKSFAGPSVLLRYSINEFIELRVFNQYEQFSSLDTDNKIAGLSDLELGVKLQLFKKDSCRTEIAFLSHAVIPTAKKSLSNESLGNISKLCVSHSMNSWFGVGYNLGYVYLGEQHSFVYSVALGFSITNKIGCYVEPYGSYTEAGYFESNFDGGLTYLLKQNLQLDASYGFGLNHNMNYFSLGFSWNFADVF